MPHKVKGAHEPFLCLLCWSTRIIPHRANKGPSSDSFGQLPNLFWSFRISWVSLRSPSDVMGSEKQYASGSMPSQPVAVVLLPCDWSLGPVLGCATQRHRREHRAGGGIVY